jgi:hypothetical protein
LIAIGIEGPRAIEAHEAVGQVRASGYGHGWKVDDTEVRDGRPGGGGGVVTRRHDGGDDDQLNGAFHKASKAQWQRAEPESVNVLPAMGMKLQA